MRFALSLTILLGLAASASADPATARRLFDRALSTRDAAGLDAAVAADQDGDAFLLALRPRDYAALSRFAAESEAAREILRRSVGDGARVPLEIEAPLTVEAVEENAVRAVSPPVLALSALLGSDDRDLAVAAAARLAEIGDPRAIAPMKDLIDRMGSEPGVQSIEVDVEDLDLLGHSYYGSAGSMIDDLVALLLYRRAPERRGLEHVGEGVRRFWRLR